MSDRGFYLLNAIFNLVNAVLLLLVMFSLPALALFVVLMYSLWGFVYWCERFKSGDSDD